MAALGHLPAVDAEGDTLTYRMGAACNSDFHVDTTNNGASHGQLVGPARL